MIEDTEAIVAVAKLAAFTVIVCFIVTAIALGVVGHFIAKAADSISRNIVIKVNKKEAKP